MELKPKKPDFAQDPQSFINYMVARISSELNKNLEDLVIEGLKRKGFEFEDKIELEEFLKLHCKCEDTMDLKQRIYFVNGNPFFVHFYETEMLNPIPSNLRYEIPVNYGSYAFI
jgi:hypothetical protein